MSSIVDKSLFLGPRRFTTYTKSQTYIFYHLGLFLPSYITFKEN